VCATTGPGLWLAPGHLACWRSRGPSLRWRLRRCSLRWAQAVAAGELCPLSDVMISGACNCVDVDSALGTVSDQCWADCACHNDVSSHLEWARVHIQYASHDTVRLCMLVQPLSPELSPCKSRSPGCPANCRTRMVLYDCAGRTASGGLRGRRRRCGRALWRRRVWAIAWAA
jgi:hypothetical protein